jgi:hypothetical protein
MRELDACHVHRWATLTAYLQRIATKRTECISIKIERFIRSEGREQRESVDVCEFFQNARTTVRRDPGSAIPVSHRGPSGSLGFTILRHRNGTRVCRPHRQTRHGQDQHLVLSARQIQNFSAHCILVPDASRRCRVHAPGSQCRASTASRGIPSGFAGPPGTRWGCCACRR